MLRLTPVDGTSNICTHIWSPEANCDAQAARGTQQTHDQDDLPTWAGSEGAVIAGHAQHVQRYLSRLRQARRANRATASVGSEDENRPNRLTTVHPAEAELHGMLTSLSLIVAAACLIPAGAKLTSQPRMRASAVPSSGRLPCPRVESSGHGRGTIEHRAIHGHTPHTQVVQPALHFGDRLGDRRLDVRQRQRDEPRETVRIALGEFGIAVVDGDDGGDGGDGILRIRGVGRHNAVQQRLACTARPGPSTPGRLATCGGRQYAAG